MKSPNPALPVSCMRPRSHTPRSWLQRVALHYVCAGAGPKVDCAVGPASSPAAALSSSSASSERPGWCYPTGRCAYLLSVTCDRQSIKPPPPPSPSHRRPGRQRLRRCGTRSRNASRLRPRRGQHPRHRPICGWMLPAQEENPEATLTSFRCRTCCELDEAGEKDDCILSIVVKSNLSESRVKLSVSEGQCARAVLCGVLSAPSALSDHSHLDPKMSAR